MYEAVLFDLDDTLADRAAAVRHVAGVFYDSRTPGCTPCRAGKRGSTRLCAATATAPLRDPCQTSGQVQIGANASADRELRHKPPAVSAGSLQTRMKRE